jgi:serine/threonine protein phosphatase 1
MGNHERMFLDYITEVDVENFLFNGGTATLNSYRNNGDVDLPPEHISFLNSLETMIELENYYIVHAGFRPDAEVGKQTEMDKLWIREEFIFSDYDFGKKVVFGHTPFSSPLVMDNKIGLDTGAVYGNKLTCLELPDEKFHYVEA